MSRWRRIKGAACGASFVLGCFAQDEPLKDVWPALGYVALVSILGVVLILTLPWTGFTYDFSRPLLDEPVRLGKKHTAAQLHLLLLLNLFGGAGMLCGSFVSDNGVPQGALTVLTGSFSGLLTLKLLAKRSESKRGGSLTGI